MADQIDKHLGISPGLKIVWTFLIIGGTPFTLSLPGNPSLDHSGLPGQRTLWRLVGTPELANQAEALLKEQGSLVEVYAEFETEDQHRQRHSPDWLKEIFGRVSI